MAELMPMVHAERRLLAEYLEFLAPGASKGDALAFVAEKLGIPMSAVMAMDGSSIRSRMCSYDENTTAGPRWRNSPGDAAEVFSRPPPGASDPRTTANAPSRLSASAADRMAGPVTAAPSICSPQLRPEAVEASSWKRSASSATSAGTPPARWKSCMSSVPDGSTSATTGTERPRRPISSRVSSRPARHQLSERRVRLRHAQVPHRLKLLNGSGPPTS